MSETPRSERPHLAVDIPPSDATPAIQKFVRDIYNDPGLLAGVTGSKQLDRGRLDSEELAARNNGRAVTRLLFDPQFGSGESSKFQVSKFKDSTNTPDFLAKTQSEITLLALYKDFDSIHNPANGNGLTVNELKAFAGGKTDLEKLGIQNAIANFDKISALLPGPITKNALADEIKTLGRLEVRAKAFADAIAIDDQLNLKGPLNKLDGQFEAVRTDKSKPYITRDELKYAIAQNVDNPETQKSLDAISKNFKLVSRGDPGDRAVIPMLVYDISINAPGITRSDISESLRGIATRRAVYDKTRFEIENFIPTDK